MIDVNEMRRKFPAKDAGKARRKNAAIKQIARDYEMKKAELNGLKAPALKKGPVFYVVMLLGLMLLASLIMSVTGKGGRAPISRAHVNARKSLKALALALGRYRYHTGSYPASLDALASTRIVKAGWNGPYVKQIVDDPWGQPYVYVPDASGGAPTLYSRGPDMVDASLFDEPFRDTSWTKDWMPYQLRGIVVAPDEATRQAVRAQVTNCLAATSRADAEARARHAAFLEKTAKEDVERRKARPAHHHAAAAPRPNPDGLDARRRRPAACRRGRVRRRRRRGGTFRKRRLGRQSACPGRTRHMVRHLRARRNQGDRLSRHAPLRRRRRFHGRRAGRRPAETSRLDARRRRDRLRVGGPCR